MSELRITTEDPDPVAYNVGQAAKLLGVSKGTIYHAIERGQLPSRRAFGRRVILRDDLLRALEDTSSWKPRRAAD